MATGTMSVMGVRGDTKIIWDAHNAPEVENARQSFDSFKKKGYLAFSVKGDKGEKGSRINDFDPLAERIIFVPPLAGG